MQEYNNENNTPYQFEEIDRPANFGGNAMPFGGMQQYGGMHGGWKKPWHDHDNWYGPKWPYWDGAFMPYGGYFGWPWFLFALKSMHPRDAAKVIEEVKKLDGMNF